MVEEEFTSSERQTTENRNTTVNNPNECFQNSLGAVCQGTTTEGTWSYQERTKHFNILELIAVKLAILTITKGKSVTAIHLQIDNMTALSYLVKMGGTRSPELLQVAKEIWDYLLANGIAVTAEYLPSSLNIQADWQSRNHRDSSDWKLNPKIFSQIVKIRGIPQIDLFASRLNHQLPKYMSWHPDPGSCAVDSLQHSWRNLYGYAFPPFCLIGKVLAKVRKDQSLLFIVTPAWQTQPWYAALLAMSVQHPIILPNLTTLLQGSQGGKHPLQAGNQLQLVAWKVSGKLWKVREYQNSLPHLSQIPEGQGQYLITNRPGESGLAGAVNGRLIPLQVI